MSMDWLLQNITSITWQMAVMWVIGGALIYCAIKKDMEPTLLLPMGLGAILVNLPEWGALKELQILYDAGGPVRHLLHPVACAPAGLLLAGRGLHRHHRRGGRPDLHLRGAVL